MISSGTPRFFDIEQNVRNYIESREGLDGRSLIEILKLYLKAGSTLLELGMGPGKDLEILCNTYIATGSDNSAIFTEIYKEKHPDADILILDAVTLRSERKFDCIYSNKVLHHLSRNDLALSITRQHQMLNNNGLLFHTFWKGNNETEFMDLRFVHYSISELRKMTDHLFEVVEAGSYGEMNLGDSIYLILRKKR
ncbi:MAG: class I SAM-dependent methyltransferase [Pyrinomonadaceae bacterium]